MGYTHHWVNKSKRKSFNEKQLRTLKNVLNYWHRRGVICYECDQPNDSYLLNSRVIRFNGKDEDGHETFQFSFNQSSDFCKTARKPYDQCVCEVLLLLSKFLGKKFWFKSDGFKAGTDVRTWNETWDQAWKGVHNETK